MGALAGIVLEKAVEATLVLMARAAAAVAGGAVVADIIRGRIDQVDKAKDGAVAQTASDPWSNKPCQMCPPDCGTLVPRGWHMSDVSRGYQARVTGFAPGSEWFFAGIDFDGFQPGQCLLQEAKARYDQFFDKDGEPKLFFKTLGIGKIRKQARSQHKVVVANPPSKLTWYFMEPLFYTYAGKKIFKDLPFIKTVYQP